MPTDDDLIEKFTETIGINVYHGAAAAAAAAIVTLAGGIKELGDLGGFSGGEKMDVSRKNQTGRVKRQAPKMISAGPISFTLNFDAANFVTLAALKMLTKGWKVVFPDAPEGGTPTTIHGDGFMTECKIQGNGDEATIAVAIEPVDEWAVTPAATGG